MPTKNKFHVNLTPYFVSLQLKSWLKDLLYTKQSKDAKKYQGFHMKKQFNEIF
jgi:hypothetical protein